MDQEIIKSKIWNCTILFEELDDLFGDRSNDQSEFIIELLNESLSDKNGDAVEYLIYAADKNGIKQSYVEVLCKLLDIRGDWQYKHEDIATLLGKTKSSKGVPHLYQLAYDFETSDIHSIPLKAMWSLRLIGNEEAIKSLRELSLSSDEKKAQIAKKQLEYLEQKEEST